MNQFDRGPNVNPQVLTMQIIAGALIAGVVTFATITIYLGAWNDPQEGFIKYVGLIFTAMVLAPFVLVPSFITAQNMMSSQGGPSDDEIGALLNVYQTRMIVRFALLEGAAFLNLFAFLIEHARWSLGVAGALVIAMLVMFPTRTRVEHWVEAERTQSGLRR